MKAQLTQESKDEIIKALQEEIDPTTDVKYPSFDDGVKKAIFIIESFPVSDGWIPVSERLPEGLQWCHTFGEFGMTDACWYPKQKIWVHPENLHEGIHVTHWQPLPNPPTSHK